MSAGCVQGTPEGRSHFPNFAATKSENSKDESFVCFGAEWELPDAGWVKQLGEIPHGLLL